MHFTAVREIETPMAEEGLVTCGTCTRDATQTMSLSRITGQDTKPGRVGSSSVLEEALMVTALGGARYSVADSLVDTHNRPNNDVRWTSGWTGQTHTAEVRFWVREAKAMIADIKTFSPAIQKQILSELAERNDGGNRAIGLSRGAAKELNAFAASIGSTATFKHSAPQPAPMG